MCNWQVVESRAAAAVHLSSGPLNSAADVRRPGVPRGPDGRHVASHWHRPAADQQNGQCGVQLIVNRTAHTHTHSCLVFLNNVLSSDETDTD